MKKLSVKTTSKNYKICIGEGLSKNFNFDSIVHEREIFIIVDKNVPKKIIDALKKNLSSSFPKRIIGKIHKGKTKKLTRASCQLR